MTYKVKNIYYLALCRGRLLTLGIDERAFYLSWRKPVCLWGIQGRTLDMGRVIFLRTAVSFLPQVCRLQTRISSSTIWAGEADPGRCWVGIAAAGCTTAFRSLEALGVSLRLQRWELVSQLMLGCICILSAWSRGDTRRLLNKCWLDIFFFRLPWVFIVVHRLLLLQTTGSRARAQELWFRGLVSYPWSLPRSWIKSALPALEGRFLTTEQPGKSIEYFLNEKVINGMWCRDWVLPQCLWKTMPVKSLDASIPELPSSLLLRAEDIFSQLPWQLISKIIMIITNNK